MKLRIPTIVVVLLMVLVAFSGMSRSARADASPDTGPGLTSAGSPVGYTNGTPPSPPPEGPDPPLSPTAIVSGQNTYVYNFDVSDEAFTKQNPQTYSEVAWDGVNKRVSVTSDRRDTGDELFIRTTATLDTTSDFTVIARWTTTQQGNWQAAFPVFLTASANTQILAANSIFVYYYSRDSNLGQNPSYFLGYRDTSGTNRIWSEFVGAANTEYHFFIRYDSSISMLTMEVRDANDVLLKLAHYRTGAIANDGFTVGKIGVASHGMSLSQEPVIYAWTDDLVLTYATGSYRDVTEDQGDHVKKIGWLADNFNDNTNEIWTVVSGSVAFSNGHVEINGAATILAGSSWYDAKFESTVNFASECGILKILFRYRDASNYYWLEIACGSQWASLHKIVGGTGSGISAAIPVAIVGGTNYRVKVVALGDAFEFWWQGQELWSGSDPSPGSPMSGNIGFVTSGRCIFYIDDVRVWNTAKGIWTDIVRDAGAASKPLRSQVAGTVDAFNQIHLQERSSADNVAWGPWTNLKADVKAATDYAWPDQDRQRYYQVRAVLTSGAEGTPSLTSVTTATGTPSTNPIANTGFEAWYPYVGGLVNAVNGNVWYSTSDLSSRGKGFILSVVRSYNGARGSSSGPFGSGWTFNYNEYLTVNADNSVTWDDGDGSQHTFRPKANASTYDSPRGVPSRLIKNADNSFTLWHKDGTRETFTSTGKLSFVVDKNGNVLTLTYASGRLTSVVDASGKALYFAYDASGRIIRVWDQEVGTVQNNPTANSGDWTSGANGYTSNNQYARKNQADKTHTYSGYGFTATADVGIWKVEACVEAYTAGDDDLGVKISTDGGATWSTEQVVNLPTTDPNTLTCLDFTSHKATWWWSDLSNTNFRVQVRYVKVGGQASYDYLDWIPVKVSTASRLVRYVYDGSGNLYQVVDTMGVRTEQYWYSSNKLTEMTDHTGGGKYTKLAYDASSRAIEIWLGSYNGGVQWKYRAYLITYSSTTTRTITNARGYATTLTLNSFGNPTQSTGPPIGCAACDGSSNTTSYAWDGEMNKVRITDGRGFAWTLGMDPRSNTISRSDPGGNVSTSAWSELNTATQYVGLMAFQTTFRGYSTFYSYDAKGNLVKVTDAKGNYADYVYDASGFLNRSTDFRRYTTWYEYNANGYLTKATDPLNRATRYGYDAWGRTTSTTSPLNFVTTTEYDKVGRVTKVTDPLLHFTSNLYNARGDLIQTTDKNGNSTTYQTNVTNGKVQVQTDALGNSTSNAFDLRGNVLTVTDANNHVTRYEYDSYDRLTKVTTPKGYVDGFFTSYAYDIAGNRLRRTDANGAATVYTYHKLERLAVTRYANGSSVTQTYDEDGSPLAIVGIGYGETMAYDELGRVTSVPFNYGSFQKTTAYTYDANGNRLTMKDAEGGTTAYAYDAANRQWQVTDPESRITTYVYDKDSRVTSITYPNGVKTTNTWDDASRLTKVSTTKVSNGAVIESFEYTHDKAGNRLSVKLADGSVTSYEYDKLSRLGKMTEPGPWTTVYTYDAVGNLMSESPGPTYTYDVDDRLTKIDWGGSIYLDYTYDNNGNRRSEGNPSRGYSYFTYDYENRLISGYDWTHTYAPTGERVSTGYTSTTYYGHDFAAAGGLSDTTAEYDSAGTRQARYTQGPFADEPVGVLRSGSYYTYQKDGLGSVSRITDGSQNTVNSYEYSPWGDTTASGPLANPFRYTGREADGGSQLYHYRARVYDPLARRFVQRDPTGMLDGTNLYAYVADNPVNRRDPSGTHGCDWWQWILSPLDCTNHELSHIVAERGEEGANCVLNCVAQNPFSDPCQWGCLAGIAGLALGPGALVGLVVVVATCFACMGLIFAASVNYVYDQMIARGGSCPCPSGVTVRSSTCTGGSAGNAWARPI